MNTKDIKKILVLIMTYVGFASISCTYRNTTRVVRSSTTTVTTKTKDADGEVITSYEEHGEYTSGSRTITEKRTTYSMETTTFKAGVSLNDRRSTTPGSYEAVVVYEARSCDYFVLESPSGYIIVEWKSGIEPDMGDEISGKFNSFGSADAYNESKQSEGRVWIDNFMLDKEAAITKIKQKCH